MFCTNCGKEIDDKAVICPHCQTKLVKSNNVGKKVLIGCLTPIILLIMMITIPSILIGDNDSNSTNKSEQVMKSKPKLEVIETSNCGGSYGIRYVCGTVKNNSSKNYGYVQVEISLLDSGGNIVGSTMANVNNLGPEQSWKFKAIITENSATKYEVKDVKGF